MKSASRFVLLMGIAAALLLAPSASAQLPDAPGKDVTLQLCSNCHGPDVIEQHRQSRDEWISTIQKMVSSGLQANEDQLGVVLEYLSKNFGPAHVNVNKASGDELEKGLGLTAKEAAAIVKYRTDKGPFKAVDDLKKVPDLDFKKIELQKDRLDF